MTRAGALWRAVVITRTTVVDVGNFETEEAAARAHDKALIKASFRRAVDLSELNFPDTTVRRRTSPRGCRVHPRL